MKENDIDKIFRDKLAGLETPVDTGLWAAIEKSLDSSAGAAVPLSAEKGGGVHWSWRKVLYYGASIAAILLIALLLWPERGEVTVLEQESPQLASKTEYSVQTVHNAEPDGMSDVADGQKAVDDENGIIDGIGVESVGKMVAVVGESVTDKSSPAQSVGEAVRPAPAVGSESPAAEKIEEEKVYVVEAQDEDSTAHKVKQENIADEGKSAAGHAKRAVARDYMEEVHKSGRRAYTLAVASNFISSSGAAISPQYLNYMSMGSLVANGVHSVEQISKTQYSLPINFGLQAQVRLNSLLSVGVGVNYTLLKSKYEALINKKYYRLKQHLHYVGVPINLYFRLIDKSNFYLYANLGGSFEKGISASYKISSYDTAVYELDGDMGGIQYSGNIGFGMEYKFIPQMGIYLEPNLVYYFNSEMPASIRTDQPLQVKAEIGLRFHLNNGRQ